VGWNASGCLGYHLDCAEHMGGTYNLNQSKIFELALNDGYDRRTGKQLGLHTGDPASFTSLEQVMEAYFKQVDYFVVLLRKYCYLAWTTEIANSPMSGLRVAMLFEDCIPAGLTSREGGCRYPEGRAPGGYPRPSSTSRTAWRPSSCWFSTGNRSVWRR
jgi:formate C-acetyltransferase